MATASTPRCPETRTTQQRCQSGRQYRVAAAALLAAVQMLTAHAQPPHSAAASFDYGLRAQAVADGVYVVPGANADFAPANGCNIINAGFIVTSAGAVVINTGPSRRYGEQLRALIRRTTGRDAAAVLQLNLHPDYFLGNAAFEDLPRYATAATRQGAAREADAYLTNLYRLCGDWMAGTQAVLPDRTIAPGTWQVGDRMFELRELRGHTASDLVLTDQRTGVTFAGGLIFAERIPTTPHAELAAWQASLDLLERTPAPLWVPSHGVVRKGAADLQATRAYLHWLDTQLRSAAKSGLDLNEVLRLPLPAPYRDWAAASTEYPRNVMHLYPGYEQRELQPAPAR